MEVIENAVFALVGSDKRHTVSLSGVFVGEALRIGAGLPFAERLACHRQEERRRREIPGQQVFRVGAGSCLARS